MMTRRLLVAVLAVTAFAVVCLACLVGCGVPSVPATPIDVHILPADNHGCEIVCRDGLCIIKCAFKNACKPEGEATCIVANGQMRVRPSCGPMYVACRSCKCLKNGTYKGYFKDGFCTFKISLGR